ncbi:uncharacterized protein LOC109546834 isoform X1 [Dendroctonus ponderosae]|uniref:uncharacterized protein LOC109546834 isoform X1 n=1 Tax=Dendroctonus ponderosae TaxID=77166 RepID=UPI002036245C|nr:uncharacterized protein LOC109546834 isoform X1 [Dendroctonus ponderosae]
MEIRVLSTLVLVLNFLAICALPGRKSRSHQARNQQPQTCQLQCPGLAPIGLPPYFLQNSTSTAPKPQKPGQSHPLATTPSGSAEDNTDATDESTETSFQNGTRKNSPHHKLRNAHVSKKVHEARKKPHSSRLRTRHTFRKETRILKRAVTARLLRQHKHLKEKAVLDGCHVVCTDDADSPSSAENPPVDQDSEEPDSDDNYVEGEDTPIEIIYVPSMAPETKEPSEVYQINNYEIVEPVPFFGYGPVLMEGKHKTSYKRKQHKGSISRNISPKHP